VARRLEGRDRPPANPFILSVGNLSLGGSGKTPVTERLALDLAAAGLRPGVLTRGYGSTLRGPALVEASCSSCGDEARMLAGRLEVAGVPVVQAADRPAGLAFLMTKAPDRVCVIVEDGFQTRGLGRHLDVLILDAWDVAENGVCRPLAGPVFPRGSWREPATAARRAGIWLLETPPDSAPEGPADHQVASFTRSSRLVGAVDGRERDGLGEAWASLAGIARPEALERDAATLAGSAPTLAVRCRDHEPYPDSHIRRIADELSAEGVSNLVTTAKDWVKLQGRAPAAWRVFLVVQTVHWGGRDDALPERVRMRVARHEEGVGG